MPSMGPREAGQFDFIRKIYEDPEDSAPGDPSKKAGGAQRRGQFDMLGLRKPRTLGDAPITVGHPLRPIPTYQDVESTPSESQIDLLDTNIKHILPLFARAISDTDFELDSSADSSIQEPYSAPQIRAVVIRALSTIAREIVAALTSTGSTPPDILIWRTFESQVLPLVQLLQMPAGHKGFARMHEVKLSDWDASTIPTCLTQPQIPKETPVLPVVTILYPSAVLLILRTYGSHLPSSNLINSMVPRIRQFGPASTMLAQNVHFLNALLKIRWNVYSDLHGIDRLLRDFTRDGVMLDEGTLQVVREIKADRAGDFAAWEQGQSMESEHDRATTAMSRPIAWWKLPGNENGFRKIDAIGYRDTEGWETEIKGNIEIKLNKQNANEKGRPAVELE